MIIGKKCLILDWQVEHSVKFYCNRFIYFNILIRAAVMPIISILILLIPMVLPPVIGWFTTVISGHQVCHMENKYITVVFLYSKLLIRRKWHREDKTPHLACLYTGFVFK